MYLTAVSSAAMEMEEIRACLRRGAFFVTDHDRYCHDLYSPEAAMDKRSSSQKKRPNALKACPECGAPMRWSRTTLHFERGGFYADVENVAAMLCGRCGTRKIPGPAALKISTAVERLFQAGKGLDSTGISFHKVAG